MTLNKTLRSVIIGALNISLQSLYYLAFLCTAIFWLLSSLLMLIFIYYSPASQYDREYVQRLESPNKQYDLFISTVGGGPLSWERILIFLVNKGKTPRADDFVAWFEKFREPQACWLDSGRLLLRYSRGEAGMKRNHWKGGSDSGGKQVEIMLEYSPQMPPRKGGAALRPQYIPSQRDPVPPKTGSVDK